jgi:hypothetical protein
MRNLVAFVLAALASMAAAPAQPLTMQGTEPPLASAFGPDPVIQITTTFRARIEGVTDAREVPSTTAQDSARRTLYNMAANECTVLAEYWKAECRLNSFSVYVPLESQEGPGAERGVPSMFGTAVYELKPQSSGR